MNVVLLGSGNVATHMGKALKLAGHSIVQVWSRTFENAQLLASVLNAAAVAEISDITPQAEIYIISVSDDAISKVAASIPFHNRLIIHTSGSVDIQVLHRFSAHFGVLYPLQTFSKSREVDFSIIPIAVEGSSAEAENILKEVSSQLSSKVYFLNSEKRRVLHLAAVFASNFTNHLYALAGSLLSEHHLDFDMIRPLITEAAGKVQDNSPKSMQTGPAVRHDKNTMAKHLEMLEGHPELYKLYQLLSQSIVNLQ